MTSPSTIACQAIMAPPIQAVFDAAKYAYEPSVNVQLTFVLIDKEGKAFEVVPELISEVSYVDRNDSAITFTGEYKSNILKGTLKKGENFLTCEIELFQ